MLKIVWYNFFIFDKLKVERKYLSKYSRGDWSIRYHQGDDLYNEKLLEFT